jgi:hypothetical protein
MAGECCGPAGAGADFLMDIGRGACSSTDHAPVRANVCAARYSVTTEDSASVLIIEARTNWVTARILHEPLACVGGIGVNHRQRDRA